MHVPSQHDIPLHSCSPVTSIVGWYLAVNTVLAVYTVHRDKPDLGVVQTVQYIQPQHAAQLSQAELVVIDEAAAIPLPVVRTLLGPYLVFLCSTVNGYEGTGRSLSLKLIEQLRTEVKRAEAKVMCSVA